MKKIITWIAHHASQIFEVAMLCAFLGLCYFVLLLGGA